MEGCFMFQWGWGVFQMGGGEEGFIFKWKGMPHGDGISFDRGTSKKNCRVGGGDASLCPLHYGKPRLR